MPAKRRPESRMLQIEVPEALARRLDDLLRETRRSLTEEVAKALEFWLEREGAGESAVEPPAIRTPRKPS